MVYTRAQTIEVEKDPGLRAGDAERSKIARWVENDRWSPIDEASAARVVEAADLLGVPFVAQLNDAVLKGSTLTKGWCAQIAEVRRDGSSVGIQVWHELKTVVVHLDYADHRGDEIVFVHLRANRFVRFRKVAAHFGAQSARHLSEERMRGEGWQLGCVNPFTSLAHRHLFDFDLQRQYSHRGEVWTNLGNRRASIRFKSKTLLSAMEERGIGLTARVTSGGSASLARIDRMLKARLVIILGNPPFLVQEYLDLWMQAQHRFLSRSEEIHLEEIAGEERIDTRKIEPDGDQWFIPDHVIVSNRGGPINQIENPVYRRDIANHDERLVQSYWELLSRESDILPVLDVPDPSSAAHFDGHYRSLVRDRMLYMSILESVEDTIEEILDPEPGPATNFAPSCIEAARRLLSSGARPRFFILAGKTTLAANGTARKSLARRFSNRADLIFPDQHINELQCALEGLKKTRSSSSPGSKIKNSVRDVIFDPAYGIDRQTIIVRLAGEFRCLRQEKDGIRYARGFVFVDCLEAHVYRQLSRILNGSDAHE